MADSVKTMSADSSNQEVAETVQEPVENVQEPVETTQEVAEVAQEPVETNQELVEKYAAQSDSVARTNYKGPTGREDSWETKAHTGDPMCYDCCGPKCLVAFVAIVVVAVVCCAYISQDGTCCSICYWPF